eukprot:TRINITY_DN6966_c0_g1_i1.p1 TRINITY_DN6966_c0_g1~~TRINITY_DN6966_c0_g1_i1.p1  ORF type:complete len:879 (+),score=78.58 TRINITY_DN6966_c0_g1_i1:64-2700(+)
MVRPARSIYVGAFVFGTLSHGAPPSQLHVMNEGGIPYDISNPPGSTPTWRGQPGKYSTNFHYNVKGDVEYFDVYGEVHTKYSQVYWTRNAKINLPPEIVARFDGKVMAITGYEVDQVTHSGRQPGSTTVPGGELGGFACYPECSETDKSVPIYHAYNHHYFSWLTGKDAEVFDMDHVIPVPNPTKTAVRSSPTAQSGYPTSIVYKENPGGEFRKSYHGYPSGYAQLLHSPTHWVVEPMQIDTHNRNYGINDEVGYKPWFLPKQFANRSQTDLEHSLSPLIECPCSTRISKRVVNASTILTQGTCSETISSQEACVVAVATIANVASSKSISSQSLPFGCIMTPSKDSFAGTFDAVFNSASGSKKTCATDSDQVFDWLGPHNGTRIDCSKGGCLPSDAKYGCTGEFEGQCTWDSPEVAKSRCSDYGECMGFYCSTNYAGGKLLCFGRATNVETKSGTATDQTWVKDINMSLQGSMEGIVNLTVSRKDSVANITITGPDGAWFGIGFGATQMSDEPYAIIVDGHGLVTERKLGNHAPGDVLTKSVSVLANSVIAGIRTVSLTRSAAGATQDHFTFPNAPGSLNIIVAVGNSVELAYHKARTGAKITLVPTDRSSCICAPTQMKYVIYMNQSSEQWAGSDCIGKPRSDMLHNGEGTGKDVPNAACHMETYHGGLHCCKHQFILTDLEQDHLVPDKTDVYFLKWRYYFQEYVPATTSTPATHQHLHHWVFLIDDIVNDYEEAGGSEIGRITANLTAQQMGLEDIPDKYSKITPLVMTPHCHAPSCIREELWNVDTGEILCSSTTAYGDNKYGSTHSVFNEANYIAIRPCIYGHQPGLQTPFSLSPDTKLMAVKYFNNTYRHLGQMAQWTGLMVYDSDPYFFI